MNILVFIKKPAYVLSHNWWSKTVMEHEHSHRIHGATAAAAIWLPAYLLYFHRINVLGRQWRAPLCLWGETGSGGLQGCSYLLHHRIPGEFVVAAGGCRNRKRENIHYWILSKWSPMVRSSEGGREFAPGYFALMMGLFLSSLSHDR